MQEWSNYNALEHVYTHPYISFAAVRNLLIDTCSQSKIQNTVTDILYNRWEEVGFSELDPKFTSYLAKSLSTFLDLVLWPLSSLLQHLVPIRETKGPLDFVHLSVSTNICAVLILLRILF